jgi:anaerobic ribonucleoside-triphosphate reductase activating protein
VKKGETNMNYADIKQYDIANGPGVRVSVFVSGCTHHCKGCFNEEAWDFNYGMLFTSGTIQTILDYLKPDYVRGLTILGGEPFEHTNQFGLLPLVRAVKEHYPNKSIWCYTGYLFDDAILKEMIPKWPETTDLLSYIDILVDGPFIEEKKKVGLRFKGSENQRIIRVQDSLKSGQLVLWDDTQDFFPKQ